jgi:hypothetical protein
MGNFNSSQASIDEDGVLYVLQDAPVIKMFGKYGRTLYKDDHSGLMFVLPHFNSTDLICVIPVKTNDLHRHYTHKVIEMHSDADIKLVESVNKDLSIPSDWLVISLTPKGSEEIWTYNNWSKQFSLLNVQRVNSSHWIDDVPVKIKPSIDGSFSKLGVFKNKIFLRLLPNAFTSKLKTMNDADIKLNRLSLFEVRLDKSGDNAIDFADTFKQIKEKIMYKSNVIDVYFSDIQKSIWNSILNIFLPETDKKSNGITFNLSESGKGIAIHGQDEYPKTAFIVHYTPSTRWMLEIGTERFGKIRGLRKEKSFLSFFLYSLFSLPFFSCVPEALLDIIDNRQRRHYRR